MDQAGIISAPVEQSIDDRLRSLWQNGGSQIAVLTVRSLQGVTIEEASIKVVEQWKLGTAKADNGVLLLISVEDRSLRIEVGQGLEGSLTDAYARRIVDNVITPNFRDGRFEDGIIAGLNAIVQHTDPSRYPLITNVATTRPVQVHDRQEIQIGWFGRIVFIILILLLLFTRVGRFILLSLLMSGGRGRGSSRGGWGGGSGGGFSGGGGGFSGGGASGKW
jgi:uncharacterized protein